MKLIFLFLLLTSYSFSESYYIDATAGDDSDSGKTSGTAWQTVDKINSLISENFFSPGDKILFKKGEEWQNTFLEITNLKGNSKTKIIFDSYGIGTKPIIRINNVPTSIDEVMNSEGASIVISKSKYLTIKNLEVRGGWAGIYLYDSSFIDFENITVGFDSNNGLIIRGIGKVPKRIVVNNSIFDNKFSFPYSFEDSLIIDNQSDDGITVYSMKDGEIKNCIFKNWGHASLALDGETGEKKVIVKNKIFNNVLTSPNIAYGGRMGVDDAKLTEVYNNIITNTSVESQLNGFKNNYHNNYFSGTRIPISNESDRAAVVIQSYSRKHVKKNIYKENIIINSEGAGLKISGNNKRNIFKNLFTGNIISNCGLKTEYISLEIEKKFENETGKTKKNQFFNNVIFSQTNIVVNYRGEKMSVIDFNSKSNIKPFKDEIKDNLKKPIQ